MKIYIKEKDGKTIKIPVPMGMVEFALHNGGLITSISTHNTDEKTVKYLQSIDFHLLAENFHMLKKYKGLNIVEVKSSSGEEISIII